MNMSPDELPADFAIPNSRTITIESSINGRSYALFLGLPLIPPPVGGYRPLFLLDGNRYFASACEAVRWNFNAPDVLVVGLGYPETPEFAAASLAERGPLSDAEARLPGMVAAIGRERRYDLTLPVPLRHSFPNIPADPSASGGLDAFLDTIERDILPMVARIAPVDMASSAFFGHSLGGLAILYSLFTRPTLFKSYIAASPSIWWADRALLDHERNFARSSPSFDEARRLLITMGANENEPGQMPPGANIEQTRALFRYANMVENSRAMVERLSALDHRTLQVGDYAVFAEQDHGLSVWPAIGLAVGFAFQP